MRIKNNLIDNNKNLRESNSSEDNFKLKISKK